MNKRLWALLAVLGLAAYAFYRLPPAPSPAPPPIPLPPVARPVAVPRKAAPKAAPAVVEPEPRPVKVRGAGLKEKGESIFGGSR